MIIHIIRLFDACDSKVKVNLNEKNWFHKCYSQRKPSLLKRTNSKSVLHSLIKTIVSFILHNFFLLFLNRFFVLKFELFSFCIVWIVMYVCKNGWKIVCFATNIFINCFESMVCVVYVIISNTTYRFWICKKTSAIDRTIC